MSLPCRCKMRQIAFKALHPGIAKCPLMRRYCHCNRQNRRYSTEILYVPMICGHAIIRLDTHRITGDQHIVIATIIRVSAMQKLRHDIKRTISSNRRISTRIYFLKSRWQVLVNMHMVREFTMAWDMTRYRGQPRDIIAQSLKMAFIKSP